MVYKLKTSLTTGNNALPKKLLRNFRLIFRNFENKNAVPKKKRRKRFVSNSSSSPDERRNDEERKDDGTAHE